jgi:hypothetical protein
VSHDLVQQAQLPEGPADAAVPRKALLESPQDGLKVWAMEMIHASALTLFKSLLQRKIILKSGNHKALQMKLA